MKLSTIVTTFAVAGTMALTGLGAQSASAINATADSGASATECVVRSTGKDTFSIKNSNVTATFTVTGNSCKVDVTLAAWQAPNGDKGMPYDQQKLYSHATGTFKPGTHTLTTKLPNCYYQVDLVTGSKPTDAYGGPRYATENRLRRSLHGGTQSCTPVTPPVTPPTTPTPTPTIQPTATLAKTGASANAIVAIVLTTVVASTVAFRGYLARKNA